MKTKTTIIATVSTLLATLTSAIASTEAGVIDTALTYNSGILVLAFAGFLALVVVVQAIPAVVSLYQMIRSAASVTAAKEAAATARK